MKSSNYDLLHITHTHSLSDANSDTSEVASSELPALAETQSKELEKAYLNGQFQDAAVLRELSHRLELTDNQIQVRQNIIIIQHQSAWM